MNDQEINIAIAEACGWADIEVAPYDMRHVERGDLHGEFEGRWNKIPDFATDLNAMHEAEKSLETDDFELLDNYIFWLNEVIQRNHRIDCLVRATARQKAEAFLRALGKWKEAE